MSENTETTRGNRKKRVGRVVSDCQDKTIVVRSERRSEHPLYGKTVKQAKKFYAHDPLNQAEVGDLVEIQETRPLSKLKRWRLVSILQRTEKAVEQEATVR